MPISPVLGEEEGVEIVKGAIKDYFLHQQEPLTKPWQWCPSQQRLFLL